MNSKMILIAVIALVVIAGGAFLLTNNSTKQAGVSTNPTPTQAMVMESTPTASPSDAMASPSGTAMTSDKTATGAVKEITVTGSNYKFVPATITVKKGDTVKITFKNGGGFHDFVIDEFSVKTKTLADGAQEVVQFTADKAGTFEYYCAVGNHRQMGMVGKLIVQ